MTHLAWLFLFVLIIEILLMVPVLILFFFETDAVKARRLKKQAKQDYKNARGTAHRKLLENAKGVILNRRKQNSTKIESIKREIRSKSRERNIKIQRALVRWLVLTRLYEAHGIGETTSGLIYYGVFRGQLSDLRKAHTLHGIGPQKQYYINRWVERYQERLPELIKSENFPERQQILDKHNPAIAMLEKKLDRFQHDIEELDLRLKRINKELWWLQNITVENFIRAYNPSIRYDSRIDKYCKGIFAEWEPVPDWFKGELKASRS